MARDEAIMIYDGSATCSATALLVKVRTASGSFKFLEESRLSFKFLQVNDTVPVAIGLALAEL